MHEYKLGTALVEGETRPVALVGGRVFTLGELLVSDRSQRAPATLRELFAEWSSFKGVLAQAVRNLSRSERGREPDDLVFLPPVTNPSKLICIGANYRDHLAEMKAPDLPTYPYAFMRPQSSLAAHREEIVLPGWPKMVDWEAELALVIGQFDRNGASDLLDAIAGYTIVNDVSARDWIAGRPSIGVDWVMQKAWDRFQPTGPWITPAEFVADPQALPIELTLNGVVKQSSSTSQMVFGVREIIRHLTAIMTLTPGDIIATGTPAGVGFGRVPQEFIRAGDTVRVSIGGLGTLENRFVGSEVKGSEAPAEAFRVIDTELQ